MLQGWGCQHTGKGRVGWNSLWLHRVQAWSHLQRGCNGIPKYLLMACSCLLLRYSPTRYILHATEHPYLSVRVLTQSFSCTSFFAYLEAAECFLYIECIPAQCSSSLCYASMCVSTQHKMPHFHSHHPCSCGGSGKAAQWYQWAGRVLHHRERKTDQWV